MFLSSCKKKKKIVKSHWMRAAAFLRVPQWAILTCASIPSRPRIYVYTPAYIYRRLYVEKRHHALLVHIHICEWERGWRFEYTQSAFERKIWDTRQFRFIKWTHSVYIWRDDREKSTRGVHKSNGGIYTAYYIYIIFTSLSLSLPLSGTNKRAHATECFFAKAHQGTV